MTATVFRNVRPLGATEAVDLTVVDGVIVDGPAPEGAEVVDCGGRIALPTLVDAHIHPDKTAWGEPWVSRKPASGIAEFAAADAELYRSQTTPLRDRAQRLMAHAVTRGTRAMRAHVDVAPAFGLAGVEGVGAAREALRDAVDVQIVAFPQHGVLRAPGTAELWRRRPAPVASTSWAASTRSASTRRSTPSSTWSSGSPTGTAWASTSTSTTSPSPA